MKHKIRFIASVVCVVALLVTGIFVMLLMMSTPHSMRSGMISQMQPSVCI